MARIKDNRPNGDEGRVRLRKSVIRAATAFIDGYKRPRDINPLSEPAQNILTNEDFNCENR